jgi:hypothetical protein
MATFNVQVSVGELVNADTAEQAIQRLTAALSAAGFAVYEGSPADAFESQENLAEDMTPAAYRARM